MAKGLVLGLTSAETLLATKLAAKAVLIAIDIGFIDFLDIYFASKANELINN